jgi:hypothetical protein
MEQGAKSMEQGAWSMELGGKEHGARGMEHGVNGKGKANMRRWEGENMGNRNFGKNDILIYFNFD